MIISNDTSKTNLKLLKVIIVSILVLLTVGGQQAQPSDGRVEVGLVVFGDSWFDYPNWLEENTGYHLENREYKADVNLGGVRLPATIRYKVRNYAVVGREMEDVARDRDWIKMVGSGGLFVILSAGGNDLLSRDSIQALLNPKGKIETECKGGSMTAECALNIEAVDRRMNTILTIMRNTVNSILTAKKIAPGVAESHNHTLAIALHGYDRIRLQKQHQCHWLQRLFYRCEWVRPVLLDNGIVNEADQNRIVGFLIDRYNDKVNALATELARSNPVFYIDNRGIVNGEWADEIHPNSKGFQAVASHFHVSMWEKLQKWAPRTQRACTQEEISSRLILQVVWKCSENAPKKETGGDSNSIAFDAINPMRHTFVFRNPREGDNSVGPPACEDSLQGNLHLNVEHFYGKYSQSGLKYGHTTMLTTTLQPNEERATTVIDGPAEFGGKYQISWIYGHSNYPGAQITAIIKPDCQ